VFTKERGKVYLCSRLAQRQPSNSCPIGWERAQGLSFDARSAAEGQPLHFLSPKGPCASNDAITAGHRGQCGLGGADHSSDHGNHGISISLEPQWGYTHSCRPSFVPATGAARPSFILQPWFEEANEHRPSTSVLQEGRSYSSTGPSVKSHAFPEGQAYSQSVHTHTHTHHSSPAFPRPSVLALPAAAHKLPKPSSTFSHCAGLKGRLAGDVE